MNEEITNLIVEIGEYVGSISTYESMHHNPVLRRESRIRSIYSSLAIEQNTLSLDQVTDVIEGKRVLGTPNRNFHIAMLSSLSRIQRSHVSSFCKTDREACSDTLPSEQAAIAFKEDLRGGEGYFPSAANPQHGQEDNSGRLFSDDLFTDHL